MAQNSLINLIFCLSHLNYSTNVDKTGCTLIFGLFFFLFIFSVSRVQIWRIQNIFRYRSRNSARVPRSILGWGAIEVLTDRNRMPSCQVGTVLVVCLFWSCSSDLSPPLAVSPRPGAGLSYQAEPSPHPGSTRSGLRPFACIWPQGTDGPSVKVHQGRCFGLMNLQTSDPCPYMLRSAPGHPPDPITPGLMTFVAGQPSPNSLP